MIVFCKTTTCDGYKDIGKKMFSDTTFSSSKAPIHYVGNFA
jgi:hypothetical protein